MTPELIADYACVCGEGPLWHPHEKRLYWVDIPQGRLFRYDPATGHHEQCYEGSAIGGFTVQEDGALLLFGDKGSVRSWHGGEVKTVVEEIPGEQDGRFNDVIADPEGRVFCGIVNGKDSNLGCLYRLDIDGSVEKVIEGGIGCANGLGFTPDRKQMYFTDSPALNIYIFDYDQATGAISNQRVFVNIPEGEGVPDGMTVDANGEVWSARWDGNCLVHYAADGAEKQRVEFPAKKVSSVIFGGDDYTDMYVTTAGGNTKEADGEQAGGLFRVNLGVQGVPEFVSRIAL